MRCVAGDGFANVKLRALRSIVLIGCLVSMTGGRASASSRQDSAAGGARWLVSQQRSSGAFFSTSERPDETAEHLVGLVAGRVGGGGVTRALSYIAKKGPGGASRAAFTGRMISGIVAGGGDPADHGGTDFVAILRDQYDASTGAYDAEQLFADLIAANGALAAGEDLPPKATDHIVANQCGSGGFGYENGCPTDADTDTTAWAISVLTAAGRAQAQTDAARAWLLTQQHRDGGFGFTKDKPTSSDSTGLVLSAIAALDEDAREAPWRQKDGDDPVRALAKLQTSSGGFSFGAGGKPNGLSTRQAIVGMAGLAYPVPALKATAATPSPTPKAEGTRTKDDPIEPDATPAPTERRTDRERAAASSPVPTGSAPATGDEPEENDDARHRTGFDRPLSAPDASEDDGSPLSSWILLGAGSVLAVAGSSLGFRYLRKPR